MARVTALKMKRFEKAAKKAGLTVEAYVASWSWRVQCTCGFGRLKRIKLRVLQKRIKRQKKAARRFVKRAKGSHDVYSPSYKSYLIAVLRKFQNGND